MAVTILHKRSATPGAIPTIAGLAVGEFAVNTADGEVFFVALIDPAGGTDAANKFIFNTQRPPKADGGEITAESGGGGGGTPPPATSGTPLMLAETLDSIYNYDWYN
jgi:hypothetical protein